MHACACTCVCACVSVCGGKGPEAERHIKQDRDDCTQCLPSSPGFRGKSENTGRLPAPSLPDPGGPSGGVGRGLTEQERACESSLFTVSGGQTRIVSAPLLADGGELGGSVGRCLAPSV